MTSPQPTYQIYGRRKGKPVRRYHSDLMENLLPKVAFNSIDALPENTWLEIGFGGGEHLAHQAALHPDVTIIGAEPYLNGVAKLLAEVDARHLENVRVHYGDARVLLDGLPDQCLDRVYLLYPDPWPKERQKKRRFVSQSNLAHFHRILKPAGKFYFASDIADYVEWTLEHVQEHKGFRLITQSAEPFENWIQTRYEAKAVREGRSSSYLTYQK